MMTSTRTVQRSGVRGAPEGTRSSAIDVDELYDVDVSAGPKPTMHNICKLVWLTNTEIEHVTDNMLKAHNKELEYAKELLSRDQLHWAYQVSGWYDQDDALTREAYLELARERYERKYKRAFADAAKRGVGRHVFPTHVHKDGNHWVTVHVVVHLRGDEEPVSVHIEYFDSFGDEPNDLGKVVIAQAKKAAEEKWSSRVLCSVIVPQERLQYNSTECGVWAIWQIHLRMRGLPSPWHVPTRSDEQARKRFREEVLRPFA